MGNERAEPTGWRHDALPPSLTDTSLSGCSTALSPPAFLVGVLSCVFFFSGPGTPPSSQVRKRGSHPLQHLPQGLITTHSTRGPPSRSSLGGSRPLVRYLHQQIHFPAWDRCIGVPRALRMPQTTCSTICCNLAQKP